jgi:nicotinate-nucleotide pyrophosphorylase (carboxylating)
MSLDELRRAVAMAAGSGVVLGASGGVTLDSVAGVAETGVDLISSGALTHSSVVLDLGLDF